jgi:diguanylate cyclase (GGDEF)-like protein
MNQEILVVDDDPVAIRLVCRVLEGTGNLRFATTGSRALALVRDLAPDLILLDAQMPGMSGFQVFDVLKAEPATQDVPVIFVTSNDDPAFEVSALQLGAADFISKPINAPLVRARVNTHLRLKRLANELRRTATTDALTGIANRRKFDDALHQEWMRTQRSGEPISLLLADVDHFKLYNDRHGHPEGDECLRRVARALMSACQRRADLVSRHGGEEFMLLLPQTARDGAVHVAGRVLDAIVGLGIRHDASPTAPHLTVSIGIASYDEGSASWSHAPADRRHESALHAKVAGDLVLAADKALYEAKRAGRAQVQVLDIDAARAVGDAAALRRELGNACA